jgi:UDP-N-acetylglucosamine--N-acetylmuramyl-(pentapeptide) pyrophosphoryl-undecaprenol N-acetylglucosamine transferase
VSAPQQHLVALAAGGTGGHVFPAEALAGVLLARGLAVALLTDRRGGAYSGALGQVPVHVIPSAPMAGRGPVARASGLARLAWGTWQAQRLLREVKPAVVVGFGSYASVPPVLAAQRLGIATLIHEQNAVLGRANRFLAKRAERIAAAFPRVEKVAEADRGRIVHTGNPVRAAVAALAEASYAAPAADGPIEILVTGGSQGAAVFAETLPAAFEALPEALRGRIHLTQQCRAEQLDTVRAIYDRLGVAATLAAFFDDLPQRLAQAHLAITRSGASTCAELTVAGRPGILLPFEHATDDHQRVNARTLQAAGAAWMLEATDSAGLATRIGELLTNPDRLTAAAAAARKLGEPRAAENLADQVQALIPGNGATADERREAA